MHTIAHHLIEEHQKFAVSQKKKKRKKIGGKWPMPRFFLLMAIAAITVKRIGTWLVDDIQWNPAITVPLLKVPHQ